MEEEEDPEANDVAELEEEQPAAGFGMKDNLAEFEWIPLVSSEYAWLVAGPAVFIGVGAPSIRRAYKTAAEEPHLCRLCVHLSPEAIYPINQERRAAEPCLINRELPSASSHQGRLMAFLGGSLGVTRSIGSRKMMEGKSHGRSGSWRQAPTPMRQLFWRLRRAVLRPKHRAVSFGYDHKSYSQNFDDGLVPAHRL
ncbi:hypothetical protein VPH35_016830 [Triticum aestivum]